MPKRPTVVRYKCAILMAVRNGEQFLSEQLTSIYGQTGCEIVIYFSDDGSTDKTRNILKEFGAINLNPTNKKFGSSAANFFHLIENFDLEKKYDFVFFSDQDDIWLPNKMLNAITLMNKHGCGGYSGSYYSFWDRRFKMNYVNKSFHQTARSHFFRSPGPGFTYALLPSAFRTVKQQIECYSELVRKCRWHDWVIYAIAKNSLISWYIDPVPNALYRQHTYNDTGQPDSISQIYKRFVFLRDGSFREQILIILQLCHPSEDKQRVEQMLERFNLIDRLKLLTHIFEMRSSYLQRLGLTLWLIFGD